MYEYKKIYCFFGIGKAKFKIGILKIETCSIALYPIIFILRDSKQIERFIQNCHHPPRLITDAEKFAKQNLLAMRWEELQEKN